MFFESLAECSLGFTHVCIAAVNVTHESIHVTPVREQGM